MITSRRTTWLAVAIWAASLLLWTAGMLLWLGSASRHMPNRAGPVAASIASSDPRLIVDAAGFEIAFASVFLAVSTVGALIAARQPGIPIGWLLGSTGVVASFRLFAGGYAAWAAGTIVGPLPTDAAAVVWLSSWSQYASVGSLGIVLLLSPRGRLPSPRWRPVLWLQVASLGLAMLTAAVAPGALNGWPYIDNPLGIARLGGAPARVFQLAAAGVRGLTTGDAFARPAPAQRSGRGAPAGQVGVVRCGARRRCFSRRCDQHGHA